MKLQELIENPVAPAAAPAPAAPAPAAAPGGAGNKFIRGAEKVAGALDTVGGIASKINNFASSGRSSKVLAGVNTDKLKDALTNVVNKKPLTPQDIQVITQALKTL
jgi:hypothetical protein